MIISHKHRYLFVEVPHTGTTSIAHHLMEHYSGERILHKHATYSEFYVQANKSERKYYVFGTVRNPLDWVATEFQRFETDQMDFGNPKKHISQPGGWVTDGHVNKLRFVQKGRSFFDYLTRYYSSVYHDWFLLMSGRFNKVMRFENLELGLGEVFSDLEMGSSHELTSKNITSGKKNFEDLYDDDCQAHALKWFAPHMRRWGYEFPKAWNAKNSGLPVVNRARYSAKEFLYSVAGRFVPMRPGMRIADIFGKKSGKQQASEKSNID